MATVSEDDLSEQFETFGVTLDTNDPDIVDKLKELCLLYRLTAEDAVAEWIAFSTTHSGLAINMDTLEQLERETLSKKSSKVKTPSSRKPAGKQTSFAMLDDDDESEDLLDAYTPGPKARQKKRVMTTPDNVSSKRTPLREHNIKKEEDITSSAGSPSLTATPSQKYSSRSKSGEVVASFGPVTTVIWEGSNLTNCCVSRGQVDPCMKNSDKYKYMMQKMKKKAEVLNEMIEDMSKTLQEKHNIESVSHLALPIQEPETVVGRICCDSNGRLNAQSVMMEGSVETSAGKQVAVSLAEVKEYSLFPGQVVAMDGVNSAGVKFVASKIYPGVAGEFKPTDCSEATGNLHLLVAAGPFSTSDNLSLEPLEDLIKVIKKTRPDACILLGPFVDVEHGQIKDGSLGESYDKVFSDIVQAIVRKTESVGCELIFQPSLRDAHHHFIYPQPPYSEIKNQPKRVHFVAEPEMININGINIATTSTDILFHLSREEISCPPGSSDRLGRLVRHILTQHNFYPLYPASEEVPVDYEKFHQYGKMGCAPHIFVCPSRLRFFVKEIESAVCINPGLLTSGQVGGTYARLVVKNTGPGNDEKTDNKAVNRTAVEIVRI
ncbi:DNA polymerase alpha subunit B [Strongylocentrotus purpuratus]|uniref:DNA polymerase alpha subunit B n=1 Tax=Strongylocentrotus purpuratus TaxID=7668 RepID=A0A7M7PT99_STRPU|nr:DNA polymerase alpha subunit B [Strongylocentrotus purpuratus]